MEQMVTSELAGWVDRIETDSILFILTRIGRIEEILRALKSENSDIQTLLLSEISMAKLLIKYNG